MGAMKRKGRLAEQGFSIIELVTALLLLGILSAIVVVRVMDTSTVDRTSQLDVVKNHLRYAQSRAMSTGSPWGVTFATGKTYYLFQGAGSTTPVVFVGEDNTTVDLDAKKSDLTITSAPQTITFDAYGSPGVANITVTTNGGNILITKNTGFIQ